MCQIFRYIQVLTYRNKIAATQYSIKNFQMQPALMHQLGLQNTLLLPCTVLHAVLLPCTVWHAVLLPCTAWHAVLLPCTTWHSILLPCTAWCRDMQCNFRGVKNLHLLFGAIRLLEYVLLIMEQIAWVSRWFVLKKIYCQNDFVHGVYYFTTSVQLCWHDIIDEWYRLLIQFVMFRK